MDTTENSKVPSVLAKVLADLLNIIGGSINIESQSRKGTKVTVKIKSA